MSDAKSREGSCLRVVLVEASVEKKGKKKKRVAMGSQGAVARREGEIWGVAGEV